MKKAVWLLAMAGLVLFILTMPAVAGEKTAITYWHPPLYPTEELRDRDFIGQFMAENPEVKVEMEEIPTENMAQKMTLAVASETTPDVVRDYLGRLGDWANQGLLEDMSDALTEEDREDFYPNVLESFVIQGKLIGFPIRMWIQTYDVNKTILDRAGATFPEGNWGLDEWMQIGEKVYALGDVYPTVLFAGGRGGDYWILQNFQMFGAVLYPEKDYSKTDLNSEAGVRALKWMIELLDRGWAPPGAAGMQGREYKNFFDAGKAAMGCIGTRSALPEYNQSMVDSGVTTELQDVRVVTQPNVQGVPVSGLYAGPSGVAVFRQKDPDTREAAIRLARFLSSPELCLFWPKTYASLPIRKSVNPWKGIEAYEKTIELVGKYGTADLGLSSLHHLEARDLFSLARQEAFTKAKTAKQALDDFAKALSELWR